MGGVDPSADRAAYFGRPAQREGEREADRAADAVMTAPDVRPAPPQISSRHKNTEEEQRGGVPLTPSSRTFFEQRFARDFSGVRVHQGADASRAARSLEARAFTAGNDVYFAEGQYSPNTDGGRRLLAHELAHVVQQPGQVMRTEDGVPEVPSSVPAVLSSWPATLIVEDAIAPDENQSTKSTFLESLRAPIIVMVDQELAGTAWSARDCPWIGHYIDTFRNRPVDALHRQLRYHLEAPIPASIAELRSRIVERMRLGLREWRESGRPPRILNDIPAVRLLSEVGAMAMSPLSAALALLRKGEPGAGAGPEHSRALWNLAPGAPLEGSLRGRMEGTFGTSLAEVRVHTDASGGALAREQNAQAVAIGSHVAFAPGKFSPGTMRGDALIAHELAHTLQQRGGVNTANSSALERDADRGAAAALLGRSANVGRWGGLSLQRCPPERNIPEAVETEDIADVADHAPPPRPAALPEYVAPEPAAARAPTVAMRLSGEDASARTAAIEELRALPDDRRSWRLVLIATGSSYADTRGVAQAIVEAWLGSNPPFHDFVTELAAAPEGELGDLAIAALARAGQGGSVDLDNYRRVITARLEIVRRIQGELATKLEGLAGPVAGLLLFGGEEIDELTAAAASGDAAELSGIGIRASRLMQRFGMVQVEVAVMEENLAGATVGSELDRVLRERMTTILTHAGAMRSDADDAEFQALIAAIESAPAAFVTAMVDSVRNGLSEARTQLDELITSSRDSRTASGYRERVVDPVLPEIDRAIALLDIARAGIADNPAAVYEYLTQIGESMVSLQERVMYASLSLDAAIRAYALMDPGPGMAMSSRRSATGEPPPLDLFAPMEQGNMLDTWLSYAESFETFATERDRNPEAVRERFEALIAGREGAASAFEIWHARRVAEWTIAIQTTRFEVDALLILLSITPARGVGVGFRAFMGWLLGRAAASIAARFLISAAAIGLEATAFHFTHEALRTLAYGEEFWDEDFTTNWAMNVALFGAMSVSNAVYSRMTANVLRAGGTGATVARAGSLALEFGILQSFGVIANRIHTGDWVLPDNPQFWAMAMHNVAFMGALHVGGNAVRPINEAIGGRILRPFLRSFNARASTLNGRIAEWVRAPRANFEEAGQIIRLSKSLNTERANLARMMRETMPESFRQEDLTYVLDMVSTLDVIANRSLFDASIGLRPHETAPNVFYFEGELSNVSMEFEARGYTVLESSTSGRLRLQEPGGTVIELLQLGETARDLPSSIALDRTTRAELEAELIRLGDPARSTRRLSDDALVARHQEVQRGGVRGDIYELSPTAVIDEAARMEMLQTLATDYATGGAPIPGTRFGGTSNPAIASRLVVPLEAGRGDATAIVTVRLRNITGGGAHGSATGPARVTVRRRPDGQWTVDVEIDPRLSRADAESVLRHEIGEAARIMRRLGGETSLTGAALRAAIEQQQRASLMREGATSIEMSSHDIEAVLELGRLFAAYRADPTPAREAQVTAMLLRMGFHHRRLGFNERRTAIVDHLPIALGNDLTIYVDAWYNARSTMVPLEAASRTTRYAEILQYTAALAGLRGAASPAARRPHESMLDRIQALARAAYNEPQLTRERLLEEGYPEADIARVLREAGSGNPYRNLHAELESLIELRGAVTPGAGFGERLTTDAVTQITTGGRAEGASFDTIWSRLQAALTAGRLRSLTPSISPTGGSMNESIRLTWVFSDNSTFNIDLPGVNAQRSAGYEINRRMHGNFETAAVSGGPTHHLTETGITVPADTMPAHLLILLDSSFQARATEWGLVYSYNRFPLDR